MTESQLYSIVKECVENILSEKRNLKSKKLYDILQQHGGFKDSQKQFPDNWNLSKSERHAMRKPYSGSYSNLSDNDVIGVVDRETLRRMGEEGLSDLAKQNGTQVGKYDFISHSELSDGSYLIYVDKGGNARMQDRDNRGDYYTKVYDREHNRRADGKNQFLPMTDKGSAARDLRKNPHYWNKEGGWKNPQRRKEALNNVKAGKSFIGGPVWRHYNGYAENDNGTYEDQYGKK